MRAGLPVWSNRIMLWMAFARSALFSRRIPSRPSAIVNRSPVGSPQALPTALK